VVECGASLLASEYLEEETAIAVCVIDLCRVALLLIRVSRGSGTCVWDYLPRVAKLQITLILDWYTVLCVYSAPTMSTTAT
jgi:hypothetical protein